MKIRNGVDNFNLSAENLMMTSVNDTRIVLPYIGEMTSDMMYEAYNALVAALDVLNAEHFDKLFGQCDIKVYVQLMPSTNNPLAVLMIDVTTPDGMMISKRIQIQAEAWEITDLLTDYLTGGADGLNRQFADSFMRQYRQYCKKCLMRGGIGMNPAYREVMREMSELMRSGYTAEQIMQAMA